MATWFGFRAQAALDRTGQSVESGTGAIYALSDILSDGSVASGATPLPARGIGGGAPMATVPVSGFLTREFEVEGHEEVYWKSGSLPPVYLMSGDGMRSATLAAAAAAVASATAADQSREAAEAAAAAVFEGTSFGSLEGNAIYNGDLSLARLGSSVNPLVHLSRTFDRFVYGQQGAGSVLRWDVDTDVPDDSVSFSSKFSVVTPASIGANQEKHVRYAIEGYDFLAYRGKDATLSFRVKGSTPGVYCVAFTNYARDRTYVAEYTLEAAGVWEEKVVHVPFGDVPAGGGWNYTNDQGIGIRWALASHSFYQGTANAWNTANVTSSPNQTDLGAVPGGYIKFGKIQLNVGTQKIPYVKRPIEDTIRLCSRYLQVFADVDMRRSPLSSVTTAAVTEIYVPLIAELRALPKVSLIGTRGTDWMLRTAADGENATGTLEASPTYGKHEGLVRFAGGSYTAGQAFSLLLGSAAGRLVFDAEL